MFIPENSLLLVIDVQEKFRRVIPNINDVINNTNKLIKVFELLDIPIIVTEQYPKGLGTTVKEIKETIVKYDRIEKIEFNCFNNREFLDLLAKYKDKNNIIICGIESHVCVAQAVFSALSKGYTVHVVKDAIDSRKKSDYDITLKRIFQEGAKIASTEMIIFQLMKDKDDPRFKEISKIVKNP